MRVLIQIAEITDQLPSEFDEAKGTQTCPVIIITGSKIMEDMVQIPKEREIIPNLGGLYFSTKTFNAPKQAGDISASSAHPTI